MKQRKKLGDILVEAGKITQHQLKEALATQKTNNKKLGQTLVDMGIITEEEILKTLQKQLSIPYIDLSNFKIDKAAIEKVPSNIAKKNNLIPLRLGKGRILIAMSDPFDILAMDDVKIASGLSVDIAISSEASIKSAVNKYYASSDDAETAISEFSESLDQDIIQKQEEEEALLNEDIKNAPMVKLVNSIIKQAADSKTSDIHIEPFENEVRIRFRIDGDLKEIMTAPKSTHLALVTRIKIMSSLNIVERRIPQDGRIEVNIDGKEIDLRISILPSVYGEKVVIRLLYRDSISLTKAQLGFTEYNLGLFDKIIKAPEGIILVTGPTGSGKSTTLYTVLRELNDIRKNIITVEDPVEYRLHGITQVQTNVKQGLTFAASLRSILRQDPDIIMIGEIRDNETVEIAVRASITGHLVLSTLHTNDTASSITRLTDMGIEPFMVATSVIGIIAQRLVKRVCTKCKVPHTTSKEEMEALGIKEPATIYTGKGCNICGGTGYKGRIAIHEILVMDREIKHMVTNNAPVDDIKDKCVSKGMKTLNQTARELVLEGITTVEEMLKVTYSIDG